MWLAWLPWLPCYHCNRNLLGTGRLAVIVLVGDLCDGDEVRVCYLKMSWKWSLVLSPRGWDGLKQTSER